MTDTRREGLASRISIILGELPDADLFDLIDATERLVDLLDEHWNLGYDQGVRDTAVPAGTGPDFDERYTLIVAGIPPQGGRARFVLEPDPGLVWTYPLPELLSASLTIEPKT